MPRKNLSYFSQLQQHAQKLLTGLTNEIRLKKSELTLLEQQFESLTGLAALRGSALGAKRPRKAGGRINWSEVLAKLPKEFRLSHLPQRSGRGPRATRSLSCTLNTETGDGVLNSSEAGSLMPPLE